MQKDQKIVFCEGFEGKEGFLDHKNIDSKNHQNLHFFEGVSPWFLSKSGDFLIFSFYAKWINKKGFLKIAREKKPFQTIKKVDLEKPPKFVFFQRG